MRGDERCWVENLYFLTKYPIIPPAAADKIDMAHFFSSAVAVAEYNVRMHSQQSIPTNMIPKRNRVTSLKRRTHLSPSVSSRSTDTLYW